MPDDVSGIRCSPSLADDPLLSKALLLGVALLALLATGCRQQAPVVDEAHVYPPTPQTQLPGVPNFGKVCEGLYRGGQPTDTGYEALRAMGIRSIVKLRVLNLNSDTIKNLGFRQYHISFKHFHPETEDVLRFLSIATEPKNQPVFVHCRQGVDRTGMMIAAYRMVIQDWPRAKAIEEMERMGFNSWIIPIKQYLLNVDIGELRRELAEGRRLAAHLEQPTPLADRR